MNAPTTPVQGSQATLREFVAVVFRRRWVIIGLFFAVTLTVIAIALTTPRQYISSCRVLVTRGERESALTPHWQIMNDWEQDLASEVAKVKSTVVLQRTREELERRAKAAGQPPLPLHPGAIDVEVMGKSNVLAIGYVDLDPDVAQKVCDALMTTYMEFRSESNLGSADTLFGRDLDRIGMRLQALNLERQAIAQRSSVLDPTEQGRFWSGQIALIESRREDAQAELTEAQTVLQSMRELKQHPDMDLPMLGTPNGTEQTLMALKDKITTQQSRIAELRERYRDDAPEVQAAVGTLETLEALLRKEVDNHIEMQQSRIDMLKARLAVHTRNLEELQAHLTSIPADQKSITDIDAEVRTLRTQADLFRNARDQARITAHVSQNVVVTLLNPAAPASAQNARDYVRLALAPAFSLVVGIGLAFFIDGLDLTVRTAGQAEEYLELPVLAILSERRKGRR